MRKLIPFLFCGFAALSCSALAADDATKADAKARGQTGATVSGTGNAGSDARGDANAGASSASDNAVSEKKGNEMHGASSDSHKQNPKAGKQAKRKNKDEQSGAGATR
jgi:hypothetical protein